MPEFRWPTRVYYEDTDSGGVVYHANYLRFMERARTEWLRSLGFEQDHLAAELGVIFAVRRMTVDYLAPARFNDLLQVSARVTQLRRVSMDFAQEVARAGDATPLCRGEVQVACLDSVRLRPRAIPQQLLDRVEEALGAD
jgi:acyl-CoA thioester hydrolase